MQFDRDNTHRAVLGSFDGATSTIGALAGLLATNAVPHTILAVTGGLAVAAAVGMASGDYLAGSGPRLAGVMGAATLLGALLPALPVALVGGPLGILFAACLVATLGVIIAETRARDTSTLRAYASTAVILLGASGLSAAVALLLGTVG